MAVDTRSKRASSVCALRSWVLAPPLPDGTLNQGDRQHIALMYSGILAAGAAPPQPAVGTDRKVHPTRRPEVVTVMVVGRKQPVLALIEKQKLARDARLEQQRMAMEESARRDALVGEADAILAEIHAKQEREAVTAEKRMRNLAMAQAVQRRNKAEKEAHEKEIRRKRLKSLRKARRARRK